MRPSPALLGLAGFAVGLGALAARNLVRLKQTGRVIEAAERRLARQEALLANLDRARAHGDTAAIRTIESELDAAEIAQDAALARARTLLDLRVAGLGRPRRAGSPRHAPA